MRILLGGLLLVVMLPSLAAPVYRQTEADGSVVYSDEASRGDRVDLAPITVVDPDVPATSPGSQPDFDPASGSSEVPYSRFEIANPLNEQILPTGQAGNIQVRLSIAPELQPGDRVRLRVDGEVRQSPMRTQVFALSQLERGEHQLQAELIDAQGQVRLATPPVTLYVQRASVNLPANPNNPNR